MKTTDIFKTAKVSYTSEQAAKDAVKFITDLTGIKEIEGDKYITVMRLNKTVLVKPGVELYAIWIKNTLCFETNKVVYKISLRTDETFSMRIAEFITQKLHAGEMILSKEMEEKMGIILVG